MAYEIPPWLNQQGADPASAFVSAFSAASSAAAQRARLAQEAQETGMRLAIAEREQQRRAQLDYQKLEIQKAYNDANLGLREQQLITNQEKNAQQAIQAANTYAMRRQQGDALAAHRQGMQAQGASRVAMTAADKARKFAANQQYQQAIQAAMQEGKTGPELDAVARQAAMLYGPAISGSMAGMGSIVGGGAGGSVDFSQERAYDIPNLTGWKGVRTSKSSQQLIPPPYSGDYQARPTGVEGVSAIPGGRSGGLPLLVRHPQIKEPDYVTQARERVKQLSEMDPEEFGPRSAKELEEKMKVIRDYEASKGKKPAAPSQGATQSGGAVLYFDPSAPGGVSTNAPSWAQ